MANIELMKQEIITLKKEIEDIQKHCCSMVIIKEAIEERTQTNINLDNIARAMNKFQEQDEKIMNKIDTLYKALYIGMGGFIMVEALVLPYILDAFKG